MTAPELHPAFGACVARWLHAKWQALGGPRPFPVLEAGGGTGAAAAQVLATVRESWPELAAVMEYVLLEPGEAAAARQRKRLEAAASPVRWARAWSDLLPFDGVLWANELIDALPVHRVVRDGHALRELWIRWDAAGEGRFAEEPGPLSTPALAGFFDQLGRLPPEGVPVEVNLAAHDWVLAVASRLRSGFLLLFDYGGTAEELYSDPSRAGTLRAYRRHALLSDPLSGIGTADLTADVEFTSLMRAAEEAGFRILGFTDQRRFLRDYGIGDWLRRPPAPSAPGHLRLLSLLDPRGLGGVRVLELERGAPGHGPAFASTHAGVSP
jgi:SAM-dependent MidA family methyltransferase